MIRFGLCCLFAQHPIHFRTTTAKALAGLEREGQLAKLATLCLHNAQHLLLALDTVNRLGIRAFRVSSPLFPRYTHPQAGYDLTALPGAEELATVLGQVRACRQKHDIRLSLHPDQFVVLGSPAPEVAANGARELEYQGLLAERIGAEVITLHGGGGYGDKRAAKERFIARFAQLSERVRSRLALENDDVTYTPADLLPLCEQLGIPLVYDVHHHRCNPDALEVAEATRLALASWHRVGREPYFHVSSPREGWHGRNPRPHADYIDPADFPDCWLNLDVACTVDVEAKAKELAVLRLMRDLGQQTT